MVSLVEWMDMILVIWGVLFVILFAYCVFSPDKMTDKIGIVAPLLVCFLLFLGMWLHRHPLPVEDMKTRKVTIPVLEPDSLDWIGKKFD